MYGFWKITLTLKSWEILLEMGDIILSCLEIFFRSNLLILDLEWEELINLHHSLVLFMKNINLLMSLISKEDLLVQTKIFWSLNSKNKSEKTISLLKCMMKILMAKKNSWATCHKIVFLLVKNEKKLERNVFSYYCYYEIDEEKIELTNKLLDCLLII